MRVVFTALLMRQSTPLVVLMLLLHGFESWSVHMFVRVPILKDS